MLYNIISYDYVDTGGYRPEKTGSGGTSGATPADSKAREKLTSTVGVYTCVQL